MPTPPRKRRVRPVVPQNGSTPPPDNGKPRAEKASSRPKESEEPTVEAAPPRKPAQEPVAEPTLLLPDEGESTEQGKRSWTLDVAGRDVGEVLAELRSDVTYWVQKGRYNKVRVLRNGKQVVPDIPVGAILALEAASMAWAGVLRTAVVNLAGRLLFKVELVNDAETHLQAAKGHYERGDLDEAEAEAVRALKVDSRYADAFLLLGTMAKVRGRKDEALQHLRKARDLDPHGEVGRNAEQQARKLDPDFVVRPRPEKA
ncbi:MAG: tetratricopeptide repeat protein [Myxococcota bacterium]